MDVEERQTYYERSSQKRADDDRKQEQQNQQQNKQSSSKKNNSNKTQNATRNATQSVTRNIVSNVAMVAVGSVVVVNSYQVMEEKRELERNPIVESVSWNWQGDFEGAQVELLDKDGVVIITLEAEVNVYTKDATCHEEGLITYTAKVLYKEKEYTDTKTTDIPQLSHKFNDGQIIQLDDGSFVMEYECELCHEKFSVKISLEEE